MRGLPAGAARQTLMHAPDEHQQATEWFEVLQTSDRTQTAMTTLAPGQASGSDAEGHEQSDRLLLLLDG
ncbi:MAG TPA: hypothetical protein VK993_01440 [Chthoniobacterales bacterium]|nr:hypothetical protein [Chthoniobacterales bacterium]